MPRAFRKSASMPCCAVSCRRPRQWRLLAPPPAVGQASVAEAPRLSRSVVIDLERLAAMGYLVPGAIRSKLALDFRHIKRALLKNAQEQAQQTARRSSLIMVTSAVAGEGKTFCAVNPAMSIAMEVDTSVLLVDADVVRPSVTARLGIEADRGLLDVLNDPSLDLADVMLRTNVPKLSVLPAGTPDSRSTELLSSAAMERLLAGLASRYSDRVIVFDAPPAADGRIARAGLSRGPVLVVVDSTKTTTAQVEEAFTAVESVPAVSSILNRSAVSDTYGAYDDYGA
ncbi:AAA family ATPase [Piscinibacter aquaticus]|uniref:AAA family ATPase n=1 Tax=Piscinibacter aquaticus TaxID=392597 RepID=A0A5C6U0G6_9BURK|nr:AAA family ATPase [Piscinibacter aquaticus]